MIYTEILHKLSYNKFLVFEGCKVMHQGEYTGSEWLEPQMYHAGPLCLHACMHAKSLQSCLTLSKTMDCSPPGSSVLGILQARIPEWVAMPCSRRSSWPKNQNLIPQAGSLPPVPSGKARHSIIIHSALLILSFLI